MAVPIPPTQPVMTETVQPGTDMAWNAARLEDALQQLGDLHVQVGSYLATSRMVVF